MPQTIEQLEAELAAGSKLLAEMKTREVKKDELKMKIDALLEGTDITVAELYRGIGGPSSLSSIPPARMAGTDKFMKDGVTYGGRTVRRAPEFIEYMVDGRIDLDAIVKDGLLNPEWLRKQNNRILVDHGISDMFEYMKKHGLKIQGLSKIEEYKMKKSKVNKRPV